MTNKEALIAVLGVSVEVNSIEKAMTDHNLDSSDTYSAAESKKIDLCAIDILQGLLSQPNISEGGYSISYNASAINDRLNFLRQKNDIKTGRPTIKAASVW